MPYLKPMSDNSSSSKSDMDKSLKNLYSTESLFKLKETVLTPDAIAKLGKVLSKLKENPKANLEIITHTDSNGETTANNALTVKQSTAILTYLTSKGIIKSRLKAIGKGEAEVLNSCKDGVKCSEADHAKNRRTEFKFFSTP